MPGSFRTEFVSDPPPRTIADYAATAHAFADRVADGAGKQPGDPKQAALAMIEAVEAEHPPLYLVLGTDALQRTRENQAALASDLSAWESVSVGTDYAAEARF